MREARVSVSISVLENPELAMGSALGNPKPMLGFRFLVIVIGLSSYEFRARFVYHRL